LPTEDLIVSGCAHINLSACSQRVLTCTCN
jgi:hypothetical protein